MKLRNKETGEIKEAEARDDGIYLYSIETEQWFKYELPLLAEYWEYYIEQKEPLIKDEQVRKAVRAWAEVNCLSMVEYDSNWNAFRRHNFSICFDYDFDEHDGLEDARFYTIAELCGEDE